MLEGPRRGEICGLRWVDVCLDAERLTGALHIRQQRVEVGGIIYVGPPKTRSGELSALT